MNWLVAYAMILLHVHSPTDCSFTIKKITAKVLSRNLLAQSLSCDFAMMSHEDTMNTCKELGQIKLGQGRLLLDLTFSVHYFGHNSRNIALY